MLLSLKVKSACLANLLEQLKNMYPANTCTMNYDVVSDYWDLECITNHEETGTGSFIIDDNAPVDCLSPVINLGDDYTNVDYSHQPLKRVIKG